MTREEAKYHANCQMNATSWYQCKYSDAESLIDAIYDDFESRSCKNCKHKSSMVDDYCNYLNIRVADDSFCVDWEDGR
jgi:hypothetical protein